MLINQETPTNINTAPASPVSIMEEDFLIGATCNPNNPEECEACQ